MSNPLAIHVERLLTLAQLAGWEDDHTAVAAKEALEKSEAVDLFAITPKFESGEVLPSLNHILKWFYVGNQSYIDDYITEWEKLYEIGW
jgi:hypothetical protein